MTQFEYVLEDERDLPVEEQTVWLLRPLTYREREEIERGSMVEFSGEHSVLLRGERHVYARKILDRGLEGWRNFRDADGKDVLFMKVNKALSEETLDAIKPYAIELSNAVTESSELRRAAAKN